jgi:hypothetical protein
VTKKQNAKPNQNQTASFFGNYKTIFSFLHNTLQSHCPGLMVCGSFWSLTLVMFGSLRRRAFMNQLLTCPPPLSQPVYEREDGPRVFDIIPDLYSSQSAASTAASRLLLGMDGVCVR